MISKLSSTMKSAFDQMSRNFASLTGYSGGLSQFMDDLVQSLASGAVGITSDAKDIDSLALGGGAFTFDPDASSGLTFAFKASRFHNGLANVAVSAGTVSLTASVTNYIEVDRTGSVTANTTAFTSGRLPLFTVAAGSSSFVAANITSAKPLLTLIGANGVNGATLSAVAATKSLAKDLSSISATTTFTIIAPCTGKLSGVSFTTATAVTTSDTNYWTFSSINKGAAGSGTQVMFDTGSGNTTKATGGVAMVAYASRAMVLTTLSIGNELNVTKGDTLTFTITATSSPTTMTQCSIGLDFTFVN